MQTILYHVLTNIDLNCRKAPYSGTGDLPEKVLELPILANSVLQVIGESSHSPDPHNVWLNINVWLPQADGSYLPSSGWVREQRHPDLAKPWIANVKTVLCPPTVFQAGTEPSTPAAITVDQALKAIRDHVATL